AARHSRRQRPRLLVRDADRPLGQICRASRSGQYQSRSPALSSDPQFYNSQRDANAGFRFAHRDGQTPPLRHQRSLRFANRSVVRFQDHMKSFTGKTLRWEWRDGVIELTLDREPANEIGTAMLGELEKFVAAIPMLAPETAACIITSARKAGFSAGGDLRELYERASAPISDQQRVAKMREFLEAIHAVLNAIDEAPFVTIAAVHGVCFGGGLELALVCDIIVADKM